VRDLGVNEDDFQADECNVAAQVAERSEIVGVV